MGVYVIVFLIQRVLFLILDCHSLPLLGQVLVSSGKVLASIDTGNSILEFLHENFPDEPWPKDDAGNLIPAENFKIEDWTKITNWCANILDTIEPANYLAGEPMNDFVQEALESDPFQQSVLKTVVGQGFEQDVTKFVNSDQCESFKAYYDGVKQELEHIISNLEGDDEPVTFKNNDGEDTPLTFEVMQGMNLEKLQELSFFDRNYEALPESNGTKITPLNFLFLTEGRKALAELDDKTKSLPERQAAFKIATREVSHMLSQKTEIIDGNVSLASSVSVGSENTTETIAGEVQIKEGVEYLNILTLNQINAYPTQIKERLDQHESAKDKLQTLASCAENLEDAAKVVRTSWKGQAYGVMIDAMIF